MPKDRKKVKELFTRRRAEKKRLLAENIEQVQRIEVALKDPTYQEIVNLWSAQSDRLVTQLKTFKKTTIEEYALEIVELKAQIKLLDWLINTPQDMVDWMQNTRKELETNV